MIRIELANAKTLQSTLDKSDGQFLCTPFFSRDGLELVRSQLISATNVELVLRANIHDWVTGYGNLSEIQAFLADLRSRNVAPSLYIVSNLHAKIYAGLTRKRAYLGSANLSASAFHTNVEIMTYTQGVDSDGVLRVIDEIKSGALSVSYEDFSAMIDVTKDAVNRAASSQAQSFETDPDFDVAVQLFSTELQKHVAHRKPQAKTRKQVVYPDEQGDYAPLPTPWPSLDDFMSYCRKTKSKAAREIVDRFEGKDNLQGHIKHIFYGGLFFFYENLGLMNAIPADLAKREHVNWSDESWVPQWKSYLAKHKNEFYGNIAFSYHSLITYLPASLGGVQVTGGASSGNFKKIMPLLARMMKERLT